MTIHPTIEKLFRDSMNYWGSRGQLGRPTMALDAAHQRQPARKPTLAYDVKKLAVDVMSKFPSLGIDVAESLQQADQLADELKTRLTPMQQHKLNLHLSGLEVDVPEEDVRQLAEQLKARLSPRDLEHVKTCLAGAVSPEAARQAGAGVGTDNPTNDPNYGLARPAMDAATRRLSKRFPDAARIAVDSYGAVAPEARRTRGPSKGFAERFPDAARIKIG